MGTNATVAPATPPGDLTPAQRLQAVRDSMAGPRANIVTLGSEPTRLIDATLGAVVLYAYLVPGGLSLGLVTMAVLIGLSFTRRPRFELGSLGWVVTGLFLAVAYASVISMTGPDLSLFGWPQRAVRLIGVTIFLTVLVSGRIHYPSVIRGAGVGLVANAALFYAGVAPSPYGTLLTGYLLDKNQAGLAYTVIAVLLLGVLRRWKERLAVIAVFGGLVWLTGSRTSLAALAFGILWFLARPYLAPLARLALGAAIAWAIPYIEENYATVGEFSDRLGSDRLRGWIDDASRLKTDAAPWWGQGLGEAWVPLPQGTFFFHNSYWALLLEGGWLYLLAFVGTLVLVGIRPFRRGRPPSMLSLSGEAGAVTVLVCALSLGEVFGATAATLVLAAGFIGHLQSRAVSAGQGDNGVAPEPVRHAKPRARGVG